MLIFQILVDNNLSPLILENNKFLNLARLKSTN